MKFVSDGVLLNAVPLLLMLHMVPGAAMIQCIIFVMMQTSLLHNKSFLSENFASGLSLACPIIHQFLPSELGDRAILIIKVIHSQVS